MGAFTYLSEWFIPELTDSNKLEDDGIEQNWTRVREQNKRTEELLVSKIIIF